MADPTHRILTLLSLLESRPTWSGADLAHQLDVTTRTIRRDIDRLRELGYPVQGEQGSEGGYRLGRGGRLPPLVLDDDEAVAVVVCLRQGAAGAVAGVEEQALRALTKLDQVLPARLQTRVHALDGALAALPASGPRLDASLLTALATATHEAVRVRFDYRARDGTATSREAEPYRLVTTGRLWYLFCFDIHRDDWRTFRLDRISGLQVTTHRFRRRLGVPDPVEHVQRARARQDWAHTVTVIIHAHLGEVRQRIPVQYATCTPLSLHRTQVQSGADDLADLARHLALAALDLDAHLEVVDPPELAAELQRLAERIGSFAREPPPGQPPAS